MYYILEESPNARYEYYNFPVRVLAFRTLKQREAYYKDNFTPTRTFARVEGNLVIWDTKENKRTYVSRAEKEIIK